MEDSGGQWRTVRPLCVLRYLALGAALLFGPSLLQQHNEHALDAARPSAHGADDRDPPCDGFEAGYAYRGHDVSKEPLAGSGSASGCS